MGQATTNKYKRWAEAQVPETVHCVRINDQFLGKIFEYTGEWLEIWAIDEAEDFTREAWIFEHNHVRSITYDDAALEAYKRINQGDLVVVLDAISLTHTPVSEHELESTTKEQHWLFYAPWYWLILYQERLWFLKTRGRFEMIPRNALNNKR